MIYQNKFPANGPYFVEESQGNYKKVNNTNNHDIFNYQDYQLSLEAERVNFLIISIVNKIIPSEFEGKTL